MNDTATITRTMHVYIGWKVTLPNGNDVNFTDQTEAIAYWEEKGESIVMTRHEWRCGLERGRSFCGHCTEATFTEKRSE